MSSGNVFADLGFPDAEELDFKLALAVQVIRRIDARGLSLTSAAALLKAAQPKVEALRSYQLEDLSPQGLKSILSLLTSPGNQI